MTIVGENGLTLATYGYDNLGRRTSIPRANGTGTSYVYDGASHLTSLTHDLAGTAADTSYGVNGLNQLTTSGSLTLSHDGRGNLTGDGTNAYGYYVANRVTAAAGQSLTYDALGRQSSNRGPSPQREALNQRSGDSGIHFVN